VAKNGSNADLIKCLPGAIRALSFNCSGRAVMGGGASSAPDQQHPVKPTAAVPAHQPDAAVLHYDVPGGGLGDLEGIGRATPLERRDRTR
jgi:hypothetical protein